MNGSEFLADLRSRVPGGGPTIDENLADQDGELLLHLLLADLRNLALSWFGEGRREELAQLLSVVESGLTDGDEYVENAVAVSFVEDTPWWDEAMEGFMSTWPLGLQREAERQRAASS